MDIPHLLDDGMPTLSVLFSARWFADRSEDIANFHHLMADTIEKSVNAAKLLRNCATFARLGYQFEKTQSFILDKFENLNILIQEQAVDIGKAWKWFDDVMEDNLCPQVHQIEMYLKDEISERKVDEQSIGLLRQLQGIYCVLWVQMSPFCILKMHSLFGAPGPSVSVYTHRILHTVSFVN